MKRIVALLFFIIAGALLTQGFQCASPEMTTAKLAIKQKDYPKAEEFLEKELMKNPTNGEAWIMLAEVQMFQNKIDDAAESLKKGIPNIQDPTLLIRAKTLKYNIWADVFNKGIEFYNTYFEQNKEEDLQRALKNINLAVDLKPKKFRTYQILGNVYEVAKDTNKAIEAYKKYIELNEKNLNFADEKGLYLGINRNEALDSIGTPVSTFGKKYSAAADSIIIDEFKINEEDVFLYSSEDKEGTFTVFGWKVDPPSDWLANEREQEVEISLGPFADLAQIYFNRQEYEKSLNYVKYIIKLDPFNVDANNFLVNIYEIQGEQEKAVEFIASLVKDTPGNKHYRAQYGDILLRLNKYDEAIEQYKKALEIDPDFVEVKRNLASAYKNKAVKIQSTEIAKAEEDPSYVPQIDDYLPYLKESAQLFEEVKEHPKYSRDIDVLNELINIYEVLEEKQKFKMTLAELEAYENIIPEEQKEAYYFILLKIYDRNKYTEKLKEVQKKIDQIQ